MANTYTPKIDSDGRHRLAITVALGAVFVLAWAALFAIE